MPTSDSKGPLRAGSRVVVIGGGPGGTAAAIALKQGAHRAGFDLSVTIVEGKQFSKHYNQCAGVLSPPIAEVLSAELGIPFPMHLCQREINRYILHTARKTIELGGPGEPSYALRRVQFDQYMLEAARQAGVEIVQARVTGLEIHPDRAVVYAENGSQVADVVVGAFGMDEGTAAIFHDAVGYQPPAWLSTVVTKVHPGEKAVQRFGDAIHVFLPATFKIEFGAVTPKGNHLTINIAGRAIDSDLMDEFFRLPEVGKVLLGLGEARPLSSAEISYFKGRFPRGLARRYSGDRFVLVGDAAGLVRAFKGKGVTSGIQTGIRAARVILEEGISAEAFRAYDRANRDILDDLPYSRAMRVLTVLASRFGWMDLAIRAAANEPALRQAMFDAVSAHRPYQDVVRNMLSSSALRALFKALYPSPDGRG